MNSLDNLSHRIWSEMGRRKRLQRRVLTGALGAFLIGATGAVVLWPKPAFAFQEVKQATLNFRTVRWTETDEGVIRDLGSNLPKRIPFFSIKREHFVSRDPLDVREKWDTWGEWRGLKSFFLPVKFREKGKIVTRMSPAHEYVQGPSSGVTMDDVKRAMGQFISFGSLSKAIEERKIADTGKATTFQGKDVVAFGSENNSKYGSSLQTWYADSKSRRLVYYRLEIFDAERNRIYFRTVSNIHYDEPPPK
jgi:hypothetical protein